MSSADVLPKEQLIKYESTLVHFLTTSDKKYQEAPSTFLEQPPLISSMITSPFYYFRWKKKWWRFLPPVTDYVLNLQYSSFWAFHLSQNCQHNWLKLIAAVVGGEPVDGPHGQVIYDRYKPFDLHKSSWNVVHYPNCMMNYYGRKCLWAFVRQHYNDFCMFCFILYCFISVAMMLSISPIKY